MELIPPLQAVTYEQEDEEEQTKEQSKWSRREGKCEEKKREGVKRERCHEKRFTRLEPITPT